jgi:hypothetical protein
MDGSQGLINFELRKKLPFISITAVHRGIEFQIDHVLVDTGSAATIFASDYLRKFGIDSEPEDKVRKIVGVGGNEYVIEKRIDALIIDSVSIEDSIIQVGDMDYGFGINGIIGGDLLMRTKMIIDYEKCTILLQHSS